MNASIGSPTAAAATGPAPRKDALSDHARSRRALIGAGSGQVLEWFDWTIFAVFTPFIAHQFFNPDDAVSGALSTLAIFAVSFFMRPLGGLLFGRIADRRGRKFAMLLAMLLVSAGSLLIAIAPTFESVGVLASVWLLLARLLQGFAHGGEVGGSWTYLVESAPAGRRGYWASLMMIFLTVGTLLATLTGAVLTSLLTDTQMNEFGWRIPFAMGAVGSLYVLYLRRGLTESVVYETAADSAQASAPTGMWADLWTQRVALIQVIGLTAGLTVVNYTWSVAAPNFSITAHGTDPSAAMWAGVVGNAVLCLSLPIAGRVADRYGRRFNGFLFGFTFIVCTIPLFNYLNSSAVYLAAAMSIALFAYSFGAANAATWPCELLPTRSRATAFGLAYSLSIALFGGTAPYLRSWLSSIGHDQVFTWYTVAIVGLTVVTCYFTPETKDKELE